MISYFLLTLTSSFWNAHFLSWVKTAASFKVQILSSLEFRRENRAGELDTRVYTHFMYPENVDVNPLAKSQFFQIHWCTIITSFF